MDRGKKYAAIKKGEAGERVTSKDQVTARVAIFELETQNGMSQGYRFQSRTIVTGFPGAQLRDGYRDGNIDVKLAHPQTTQVHNPATPFAPHVFAFCISTSITPSESNHHR